MKKPIIGGIIVLVFGLLAPQIVQAQGMITYLSNLGPGVSDIGGVGSNSWQAASFFTGTNAEGYVLNSIQLGMGNGAGSPSGFAVMVYANIGTAGISPGSNLATLDGSANPSTSGLYNYTSALNLTLSPDTFYFIVLTAGTAFTSGSAGLPLGYMWSRAPNAGTHYNPSDGWIGAGSYYNSSNDGSSWNIISGTYPLYAINATAVPEPDVLSLLGLGSLLFVWHRRKAKTSLIKN